MKKIDETSIPKNAKRVHPSWGDSQILSTHVLDEILKPKLPKDAAALIAFTSSDLWPGKGWNFVFGQASLRNRVGVWSIYRNGNPSKSKSDFKLCLARTLKVATHETGHMFSMYHCTAAKCNMCGSNSLPESDTYPLYLCSQCVPKILYSTDAQAIDRYKKLLKFCKTNGLQSAEKYYEKAIEELK